MLQHHLLEMPNDPVIFPRLIFILASGQPNPNPKLLRRTKCVEVPGEIGMPLQDPVLQSLLDGMVAIGEQ